MRGGDEGIRNPAERGKTGGRPSDAVGCSSPTGVMPADREQASVHEPGDEHGPRDQAEEGARRPRRRGVRSGSSGRARRPGWGQPTRPDARGPGEDACARPRSTSRSGGRQTRGRTGVREPIQKAGALSVRSPGEPRPQDQRRSFWRVDGRARAVMSGATTVFKQVGCSLENLLADIDVGAIGLPDIQQPFVWPATKGHVPGRAGALMCHGLALASMRSRTSWNTSIGCAPTIAWRPSRT